MQSTTTEQAEKYKFTKKQDTFLRISAGMRVKLPLGETVPDGEVN